MDEPKIRRRKHTTPNRDQKIWVRATRWEKLMLQQQAATMGMSLGAYLVWAGLPPSCREDAQPHSEDDQAPPA